MFYKEGICYSNEQQFKEYFVHFIFDTKKYIISLSTSLADYILLLVSTEPLQ